MVALKRFRWLQMLAASAPAPAPLTSAFTPVRGGKTFTTGRDMRFGETGVAKGLSASFGGTKTDRSGRSETGQLSVTFEKGTKGGEDIETNMGDCVSCFDDVFGATHEKKRTNLDGSYVQGTDTAEHSLLSDSSLSSLQSEQIMSTRNNLVLPSQVLEDDDFETFIRSPIGGSKKLLPFSKMKQTPAASLTSDTHSSVGGSSVSTIRGTSLTSTPGAAIKETPGPITPIAHQDSLEVFSDMSMEDNVACQETPSVNQSVLAVTAEGTSGALPDASAVFGVNVSSRPVPGGTVRWPGGSENKV